MAEQKHEGLTEAKMSPMKEEKTGSRVQTKPQTESPSNKMFTWSEVGKHNKEDDVWVVINNQVYDVSSFQNQHPGGRLPMQEAAGRNATYAFTQAGHDAETKANVMPKYRIGAVDPSSEIQHWQIQPSDLPPTVQAIVMTLVSIFMFVYGISHL